MKKKKTLFGCMSQSYGDFFVQGMGGDHRHHNHHHFDLKECCRPSCWSCIPHLESPLPADQDDDDTDNDNADGNVHGDDDDDDDDEVGENLPVMQGNPLQLHPHLFRPAAFVSRK